MFYSKLPENFDWKTYVDLNPDLGHMNEKQAKGHYLLYGINENRIYTQPLPENFDWKTYVQLNPDLSHMNELQAKGHYLRYGINENRIFQLPTIPENFDWKTYIQLNPDLSEMNEIQAKDHYLQYGINEHRVFQLPTYNFFVDKLDMNLLDQDINIVNLLKNNVINYNKSLTLIYDNCIDIDEYEINYEKINFCKNF